MVVDFSKLNLKERQTLILKNQDGTYIQPLVFAHNLEAKLCYNEVSEITFDVPAFVDCLKTPSYDDIVGMRLIDWYGIGQFILMDPSTTNDGIKEIKTCKAYSLEYELTFKQAFLEEGTYNFWNPFDSENTVLGILMKLLPSWQVGSVDASLIGKYRTFEASNTTVYDLMKNTLQDTYQCIFDFDTYTRTVNVRAVTELVDTKPIYLSLDNLIKEINVEEDTQNIFTCLDVNGADGVDIRSVNPMGTNKIYNLDYFMNTTYFNQEMIDKWNAWKAKYKSEQRPYYNLSIEKVLQESKLIVEEAALADLKADLSRLETLQATYVEAAAKNTGNSDDLTQVKKDIASKNEEISAKQELVDGIKTSIETYGDQQIAINDSCQFDAFFSPSEIELLDRYIKESAISEETFVYQTVSSYAKDAETAALNPDIVFEIAASDIVGVTSDGIDEPSSELKAAYDALVEYQAEATAKGSHVDYLHRVVLHATSHNLEFYREYFDSHDLEVGDIITLHSFTYEWENLGGEPGTTWAINVTPIMPDGSLFESHNKFLEYVAGLFDESGAYQPSRDTKSIVMSYFDEGNVQASIQKAAAFANEAHVLHEEYYNLLDERDISAMMVRCTGGSINVEISGKQLTAHIINGAFEAKDDDTVLMTAYLSDGSFGGADFKEACISVSGTISRLTSDLSVDETGDLYEGSSISFNVSDGYFLLSYDVSEYAKRSVEWDLFEYGQENLEKLCWPTYTFSVETANFMAMDEFAAFKNQFSLGSKVYLNLNGKILQPIAVCAEFNADDPTSFKLTFGDKYSLNDSAFKMVDLLEQSISIGQTTASKLKSFNAFIDSGASGELYNYINSALNAAKNVVLAGSNQSTQIDGSGIRCRSYNPESGTFDDEQIWIINNNIVFTKDNWDSAAMALGHIVDAENSIDDWGLVANLLVGKMVAGNNLVIEAQCANNENVEFKVDQSGVRISNARLDLISAAGQISLYPETGLVGGENSSSKRLYTYDTNGNITGVRSQKNIQLNTVAEAIEMNELPNANFWIDMEGNAFLRGTVYAENGEFTGTISANRFLIRDGDSYSDILENGKIDGDYIDLMGVNIINDAGDTIITINDNGIKFTPAPDMQLGLTEEEVGDMIDEATPDVESILRRDYNIMPISSTSIDGATIESPTIKGNNIHANEAFRIGSLGFLGSATGSKIVDDGFVETIPTFGVAMAAGDENKILTKSEDNETLITYDATGNYVIATEAGVRMTYNADGDPTTRHEITVTANGCFADGRPIGGALDGVATVYAVWG